MYKRGRLVCHRVGVGAMSMLVRVGVGITMLEAPKPISFEFQLVKTMYTLVNVDCYETLALIGE